MNFDPLTLLTFGLLALAAGVFALHRRDRAARRELVAVLHDKALALDQRCDALQAQLDHDRRRLSIDHLRDLLLLAERDGALEEDAARRLDSYLDTLRRDLEDEA